LAQAYLFKRMCAEPLCGSSFNEAGGRVYAGVRAYSVVVIDPAGHVPGWWPRVGDLGDVLFRRGSSPAAVLSDHRQP